MTKRYNKFHLFFPTFALVENFIIETISDDLQQDIRQKGDIGDTLLIPVLSKQLQHFHEPRLENLKHPAAGNALPFRPSMVNSYTSYFGNLLPAIKVN
ncbi:MAG: hypothetical protein SFU99_24125 [Saprospiraceae bacterium]|nr:hypothetical protein [Saprospiraceae bacterium]